MTARKPRRRQRWRCGACDMNCALKMSSVGRHPPTSCVYMETVDEGVANWWLSAEGGGYSHPGKNRNRRDKRHAPV